MNILFRLYLILSVFWVVPCLAANKLNIVATIKPYYNLSAAITNKIPTNTQLLLTGYISPHDYRLAPKDALMLKQADIVIWGGHNLEPYLTKILANAPPHQIIIDATKIPGITLLKYRNDHEHKHKEELAEQDPSTIDPHLWLSPANARIIVQRLNKEFAKLDPTNKDNYANNANDFLTKLNNIDRNIKLKYRKISNMDYVVFHDAYQYFEHHYGLPSAFIIQPNPELPATVATMLAIEEYLNKKPKACFFQEPQFDPKIIHKLQHTHNVWVQELDPLGKDTDIGPEGYLKLLRNLSQALDQAIWHCLEQTQTNE